MVLKRIGVLSFGKIMGVLYALMGLFIGAIFTLFALIGTAAGVSSGNEEAWVGALMGVGAIIIFPVFYGVLGFLFALIGAALYNLAAGIIGGIELELESTPTEMPHL